MDVTFIIIEDESVMVKCNLDKQLHHAANRQHANTMFALCSDLNTVSLPPNKVTPEGLVFVLQWVLAALICYWLISLAFRLVASTLMCALWFLKVGVALTCFVLILSDYGVGTEVMAVRLAVLLCVCVLLDVGTRGSSSAANQTARLEEQVKILERRLREMERWTRTED
ncbi:transmembrane protein 109 [Neolamprologus brichardi]|uniref:transmembrane protein 109 n=1 Tax=Neolamprologus brichardi TaxID=32507 RepID=UPI0003EC0E2B|nr:transmembrane protein 109 [Neolamprologus brichardi]